MLGLPRRLDLDQASLRERYYQRCAEHHPDRRMAGDATAHATATLHSAEINRAYRVLRDPVTRARHFLDLQGDNLRKQGGALPRAVTDICLATHEILHRVDAGEREAIPILAAEQSRLVTLRNNRVASLESLFALWSNPGAALSRLRDQTRELLSELGYLDKLLKDLSQRIEDSGGV